MPEHTFAVLVQTQQQVSDEADYTEKATACMAVVENVLSEYPDFVDGCIRRECTFEMELNEEARTLYARMVIQLETEEGIKPGFDKKKLIKAMEIGGYPKCTVQKKIYRPPPKAPESKSMETLDC